MAMHIVPADDHVLVPQGLKSLLEREGFQLAREASDGLEALKTNLLTRHHESQYIREALEAGAKGSSEFVKPRICRTLGREVPRRTFPF
jgi:DNA-binding NarL/FixJ family response regulator